MKRTIITYSSIIGVSTYFSLVDLPISVSKTKAIQLWHSRVQTYLDWLSQHTGKPVLISEIGYRNTTDAGYHPYQQQSQAPQDDDEQAILYNAVMANVQHDTHILGVFFWAWNTPPFDMEGKPAAHTLLQWFTIYPAVVK